MQTEIVRSNDASQYTASPVAVPVVTAKPVYPEWTRLPKSGTRCPWTGLTRSKLNELVLPCAANDFKPPVRSACLRQRGRVKGVRLIHLASLLAFIEQQIDNALPSDGGAR